MSFTVEAIFNAKCKEDWTKRGKLNTDMYNYCANSQREGLQNIKDIKNKYSELNWVKDAESVYQWPGTLVHSLLFLAEAHLRDH